MRSSINEAAEDREDTVQGDDPEELNVNENAVRSEAERRTIKLEIPIDGVYATAVD